MRRYRTVEAFRDALTGHLAKRAAELGVSIEFLRRRLVFHRFLARLLQAAPDHWVLSGGTALDWRLSQRDVRRIRSTVDLDFLCRVALDRAREELTAATRIDLQDYFGFVLDPQARATEAAGRAFRFHLTASIGPKPYLMFVVDVGFVDPLRLAPQPITVADPLQDIGFGPITVPALPIPQQIAEKVHAITKLTREGRPRTRVVQDVADLVMIATTERLVAQDIRHALVAVFDAYGTHALPTAMPGTPREWARDYRSMAAELRIPIELEVADALVARILNEILQDTARGAWDPRAGRWSAAKDNAQ